MLQREKSGKLSKITFFSSEIPLRSEKVFWSVSFSEVKKCGKISSSSHGFVYLCVTNSGAYDGGTLEISASPLSPSPTQSSNVREREKTE